MMAERDGLRDLQVRVAGHDRVGVPLGQIDERAAQRGKPIGEPVDRLAQPEPQVGGHLVVARATGVEPLAGVADERGEPLLDVEMNVLEVARPRKIAALDFVANRFHPALDCGEIIRGQYAGRGKHSRVRQ